MGRTVADALVQRLTEWDVELVFGYPGDGINGILAALERAGDRPRLVQARHEEMAAFEACGYAKFSGRVGVCLATSGPGAIHLLNGLYDAKLDHVPVVAVVGQQARTALGGHYQQEVDLVSLFKDVAHEYVHMATTPPQFPALIDRAIRIAYAERSPTCVIVPADLQEEPYEAPQHASKMVPTRIGWARPETVPPAGQLQAAADVLNQGSGWPCWSARAPATRPPRSCRQPTLSVPAWPRPSSARTSSPTTCPSSPGPSACSAPSPATS